MIKLFQAFLTRMAKQFRGIARRAGYEVEVEELHSDAWIVSEEISKKLGRKIDFSDPADEKLIMSAVTVRNVTRQEKNVRYAVRIDACTDGEEGEETPWENLLQSHPDSDPIEHLMRQEREINEEKAIASSFSEYAAYVVSLFRFKNDFSALGSYLAVTVGTIKSRMSRAESVVKIQPSMFDGVEQISDTFIPAPGKQYVPKVEKHLFGAQWGWVFE